MTGAYYKRRDSVVFEAQLWSAADNAVKQAFQPVTVGERDVQLALDSLRRQALTIVALAVSPERVSSLVRGSPRSPTYEAYREYVQGIDLFAERSPRDTTISCERRGSTRRSPSPLSRSPPSLLYDNPASPVLDSIFTALSGKPSALSEPSRVWLNAMQASRRGDNSNRRASSVTSRDSLRRRCFRTCTRNRSRRSAGFVRRRRHWTR